MNGWLTGHSSYFMRSCIHTNTVTVYTDTILMGQMFSFTGPSRISSLETVWKGAGTVKKFMAGDWKNCLLPSVIG